MKVHLKKLSQKDIEKRKANYDVFVKVKEKKIFFFLKDKKMKFEKKISPELRNILKSCTTVAQRQEIANDHLMSLHTLNSVINGQRSITDSTKKCLIDLVIKAIDNAKEFNQSLINYYFALT